MECPYKYPNSQYNYKSNVVNPGTYSHHGRQIKRGMHGMY